MFLGALLVGADAGHDGPVNSGAADGSGIERRRIIRDSPLDVLRGVVPKSRKLRHQPLHVARPRFMAVGSSPGRPVHRPHGHPVR